MVQIYDGYNHEDNEEQKKKEDYIKSLLEEVKLSYPCFKSNPGYEENMNYSKLVTEYAELTTDYLELIKKDLIKESKAFKWLDEDSWNVRMEYSDEYEEDKRLFHDCLWFQDCFMSISHPEAFPGFEHHELKCSIQVKVITYKDSYKKFLLPLSKEIYYPQIGRVTPRELSGLGAIDYYVWFYWSQTEHEFKGMFILRNPKALFFPILAGRGIVEMSREYPNHETGSIKTVIYLNPYHIDFPSEAFLSQEPPLLH